MQHTNNSTLYATMRPASGGKSLVTLSTYQERRETLKHTTMMEDDVNYRSSRIFPTETKITNENLPNGNGGGAPTNGQPINIPPPPPQFANSPPQEIPSANLYKASQKSTITSTSTAKQSANGNQTKNAPRPPSSPVPDYDNVQSASKDQGGHANTAYGYTPVTTNTVTNSSSNRRTMRLGTVTIGEYDHQRKDPTKFDFINGPTQKTSTTQNQQTESLRSELQNTLSRSNLKKTNNGHLEHQSNCPLQSSPQGYENVEYRNGSNVENLTRKLQGASIMGKSTETATMTLRNGNGVASRSSSNGSSNGTGILKNGSRNSGGSFTKTTEKTLTFGN